MGLLEQQLSNGLLNKDPLRAQTSNPKMLAQALKARQTTPRNALTGQGLLDTAAIGLSPIPVIGDLLGLGADANRFINEPESRTPLNFGLAALGLIPFVPPLVSAGLGKFAQSQGKTLAQAPTGPARNQAGAIVYHGSPHKFDAFDSSKIGTGEGAQAYGHGLYFAESPDVAKSYQRTLAMDKKANDLNTKIKMVDVGGNSLESYGVDMMPEMIDAARNGTLVDLAKQRKDSWVENAADPSYPFNKYAQEKISAYDRLIADAQKGNVSYTGDGALYKVDLPDEAIAKMLDYDAPLSKQPEEVRNALKKNAPFETGGNDWLGSDLLKMAESHAANERAGRYVSGAESKDGGAALMRALGIPGVKYLDGGSRAGVGNGTRNFVVFPGNEGLLKILGRE
jgi:hypothetical protein